MQKLLVLISRVELFVKKYNCRNVSLIQDPGETTRRRNDRKPSICGEPAWLAELASLTSDPFLAGKPLVAWRNVSGYNDLQHKKKAKKSVEKCICVLLNIWRSFEMAQLVKCRQNLLGLNF